MSRPVLSLPTRNGNEGEDIQKVAGAIRFEPTYKEWKPGKPVDPDSDRLRPCFEPTYKEWKQDLGLVGALKKLSFEPTYKEWKLF